MAETAWLILPTFDEAENVERVVRAAAAVLERACGADGYRVLIVADSSPDGPGEIADRLAVEKSAVSVLHRPVRVGHGSA